MIRFERRDIGAYMRRWILTTPLGTIRIHHITRPDADPELHDHPWNFVSLVLKGWYEEERPTPEIVSFVRKDLLCPEPVDRLVRDLVLRALAPDSAFRIFRRVTSREAGSVAYRHASDPHRITAVSPGGVWTLVFTGRLIRDWGFWTDKGWIGWRLFESKKPGPVHHHDGTITNTNAEEVP